MIIILFTLTLFTSGLIIAGGITDFLKLKIPNILPALIILCFSVAYSLQAILNTNAGFQELSSHLIAFVVTLLTMMALFFFKLFGGGDAKLIAAISLWIGLQGMPLFLMVMTIAGGVLAIISVIMRKTKLGQGLTVKLTQINSLKGGWINALASGTNVVPYGIAIATGGISAFRSLGYLP